MRVLRAQVSGLHPAYGLQTQPEATVRPLSTRFLSCSEQWRNHTLPLEPNRLTSVVQWLTPTVPGPWELRLEDFLSPGAIGHPGQHSEKPPPNVHIYEVCMRERDRERGPGQPWNISCSNSSNKVPPAPLLWLMSCCTGSLRSWSPVPKVVVDLTVLCRSTRNTVREGRALAGAT